MRLAARQWMTGVAVLALGSPLGAEATVQELVFVANAGSGPVTAYPALSSGAVSPAISIPNPNLPDTYWDPWGVAFDPQQSLYVQSFLSNATSFVFPPGAGTSTPPSRIFRGGGPDSRSIAVDANGYEYVATGQGPSEILVLPPGASGQGNLYSVTPLRSIATDETVWHPWPSILTTDAANHVIAAVVRAEGNALEVFDGGAAGGSAPIRVITGPLTGLGACADTTCNMMALTYSAATAHLWVAVSARTQTHVSLFAASSMGNAAPQRTIQGPATGLADKVVTGMVESPHTRELFVLAKDAQFGRPGQVLVYGALAQDNAAPLRSFTDVSTQFADAAGIAIAAGPNPDVGVLGGGRDRGVRLVVGRNPTQGAMSARIWLPHPVHALRLEVLDVAGHRLATLWSGDAPQGATSAQWDGRSAGHTQASGVYLLRATAEGLNATTRFVWIR